MMRRLFLSLSLVLAACGDDDGEAPPNNIDGGSLDGGMTPSSDGGRDAALDASSSLDGGATLCGKYGGPMGIERAIKQFVIQELALDCDVGQHFTMLPAARLARFSDCLTFQAQELFGCPGITYAGSKSFNGLPCRDMKTAHAGLGFSTGDFDAVVNDVATGLLKAGVVQADIQTVAPALLGLESQIVENPSDAATLSCDRDAAVASIDAGG